MAQDHFWNLQSPKRRIRIKNEPPKSEKGPMTFQGMGQIRAGHACHRMLRTEWMVKDSTGGQRLNGWSRAQRVAKDSTGGQFMVAPTASTARSLCHPTWTKTE